VRPTSSPPKVETYCLGVLLRQPEELHWIHRVPAVDELEGRPARGIVRHGPYRVHRTDDREVLVDEVVLDHREMIVVDPTFRNVATAVVGVARATCRRRQLRIGVRLVPCSRSGA
jgi:hypothetical protein